MHSQRYWNRQYLRSSTEVFTIASQLSSPYFNGHEWRCFDSRVMHTNERRFRHICIVGSFEKLLKPSTHELTKNEVAVAASTVAHGIVNVSKLCPIRTGDTTWLSVLSRKMTVRLPDDGTPTVFLLLLFLGGYISQSAYDTYCSSLLLLFIVPHAQALTAWNKLSNTGLMVSYNCAKFRERCSCVLTWSRGLD